MFGVLKKDSGVAINTDNIFAALERKKKAGKKKESNKDAKKATEFWTKAPVSVKCWADCEDDDDDYYATAAPPVWGQNHSTEKEEESDKEASDDQEDYDLEDDAEEETEEKEDNDAEKPLDTTSAASSVSPLHKTREPEKQLSKKEIKKKELAELDRVLEEFGLLTKNDGSDVAQMKKIEDKSKELDSKPSEPVLAENKTSKKRKAKKDKSKGEEVATAVNGNGYAKVVETKRETNAVAADPKTILKKLASQQKKKSGKESDAFAKAAAAEAASRAAKQAAAKKKDKMHYNQHPPK